MLRAGRQVLYNPLYVCVTEREIHMHSRMQQTHLLSIKWLS